MPTWRDGPLTFARCLPVDYDGTIPYEIMRKIVLAAKKIAVVEISSRNAMPGQPVSAIVGNFYLRDRSRYSSYARRATRDLGEILSYISYCGAVRLGMILADLRFDLCCYHAGAK